MRREELLDLLAERLSALPASRPVRVAVDGVDAAGKTTLADELVGSLRASRRSVIRASIDGFHRSRAERYRHGSASPDGYYGAERGGWDCRLGRPPRRRGGQLGSRAAS